MPSKADKRLADIAIKNQAILERIKAGLFQGYDKIFPEVEKAIAATLAATRVTELSELSRKQLDSMLREMRTAQLELYSVANQELTEQLRRTGGFAIGREVADLNRLRATIDDTGFPRSIDSKQLDFNKDPTSYRPKSAAYAESLYAGKDPTKVATSGKPIIVTRDGEGKLVLQDGRHRLAAAEKFGAKEISVEFRQYDESGMNRVSGEVRNLPIGPYEATTAGFEWDIPKPAASWASINSTPIAATGELMDPFIKRITEGNMARVEGAVRNGWAQGKTIADVTRQIFGTKKNGYKDGLTQMNRRGVQAMVRTATQHTAMAARMSFFQANDDLVVAYTYIATLDTRTTAKCRALDGKVFEFGKGPLPPTHVACRSSITPKLGPEFDFLEEGATRSSADGYVDANTTYYDWLKKQSPEDIKEVLGKTRADLFRNGGMTAKEFEQYNMGRNFEPLTLEQMYAKDPTPFRTAGVRPKGVSVDDDELFAPPRENTARRAAYDLLSEMKTELGKIPTLEEALVRAKTAGIERGKITGQYPNWINDLTVPDEVVKPVPVPNPVVPVIQITKPPIPVAKIPVPEGHTEIQNGWSYTTAPGGTHKWLYRGKKFEGVYSDGGSMTVQEMIQSILNKEEYARIRKSLQTGKVVDFTPGTRIEGGVLRYNGVEYREYGSSKHDDPFIRSGFKRTELSALKKYTGDSYTEVNDVLRNGAKPSLETEKIIADLESFFLKTPPIAEDAVLYRYIHVDATTFSSFRKGAVIMDKGYTSTSSRFLQQFHGNTSLRILVDKGSTGVHSVGRASANFFENEWLIKAGAKFEVIEVKDTLVTLRYLPDELPSVKPVPVAAPIIKVDTIPGAISNKPILSKIQDLIGAEAKGVSWRELRDLERRVAAAAEELQRASRGNAVTFGEARLAYQELSSKYSAQAKKFLVKDSILTDKVKKELFEEFSKTNKDFKFTAHVPAVVPKGVAGKVAEAQEFLKGLIHPKLLSGTNSGVIRFEYYDGVKVRESYNKADQRIKIGPKTTTRTVLHEYVHSLEHSYPDIQQKANAFRRARGMRVPGRGRKLMKEMKGGWGDEEGWEDEWVDKGGDVYSGRLYQSSATEILTVGIERLYTDPVAFYQLDPEYFEFVVSALKNL